MITFRNRRKFVMCLTFILAYGLGMGILGCSKPKADPIREFQQEQASYDGPTIPVTTTRTKGAPSWIDNADREGRITAVGIAPPNTLNDLMIQRTQAVNRGMVALAGKLQTEVDSLYAELVSLNTGTSGKKILPQQALNEVKNTTRTLVSVKVQGAKVPYFWTDPATRNLFVLVQLNDRASMDVLTEAAANQPALKEALAELDATIQAKKQK